MNKLKTVLCFMLALLFFVPPVHFSSAAQPSERLRTKVEIRPSMDLTEIIVKKYTVSFDTGISKVDTYRFNDPSLLLDPADGDLFEDDHMFAVTGLTSRGLKSYDTAYQLGDETEGVTLYEFDNTTNKLRKVTRSVWDAAPIDLYPYLDMYTAATHDDPGQVDFYSLFTAEKIKPGDSTDGVLISPNYFISGEFESSFTPKMPNEYAVYCKKFPSFTDCYRAGPGVELKEPVRVTKNIDNKASQKTPFHGGKSSLIVKNPIAGEGSKMWSVSGQMGSNSPFQLLKGVHRPSVVISPDRRYVAISARMSELDNAYSVSVYDTSTFRLVDRLSSDKDIGFTRVEWQNNEVLLVHQASIWKDKFPSFYRNIVLKKSFSDPSLTSEHEDKSSVQYDLFDRSSMLYLGEPVAIQHKNTLVRYKNQPSFRYNNAYYVPLSDFAKAFQIKYKPASQKIILTRTNKSAVVDLLKVEALHYKNEIYLPLGKWNEQLGLKIMSQEKQVMSRKLTLG
ncbi:hypothetical protein M3223_19390 [Paenibacillus pasadenensis]|uniref:hypothetical protein n=1 Tax=Paenibacillus pasadenensis TaxID=217090 RepID=UPI00203FE11E|nr:hypothetical protein [Paenibacillus pasadenensis]MCM3749521.1 hypothetical protein [Paenibacillus pasadenensis]